MIFRKKYQKVSIQELGELPSAASCWTTWWTPAGPSATPPRP